MDFFIISEVRCPVTMATGVHFCCNVTPR